MRARSYTIINLLGLAFSLACSIILIRYIHRELTVDANCVDAETVVVPLWESYGKWVPSSMMYMDSVYIADGQITERCRIVPEENANIVYEDQTYTVDMLAVDSAFFRFSGSFMAARIFIFSYPTSGVTLTAETRAAAFAEFLGSCNTLSI